MIPRTFALLIVLSSAAWAQCTIALTPASAHFPTAGGNGTFTVAANPSNCTRTPSSSNDWLTISFGNTATPGSVGYTVSANTLGTARVGTITLAGTAFTVTQDAAACTYSVTPASNGAVPAAGGSYSLNVVSNCQWTPVVNVSWVTLTSSTTYTVAATTTTQNRAGTIVIGTYTFNIVQLGVGCTYSVMPAALSFTSRARQAPRPLQRTPVVRGPPRLRRHGSQTFLQTLLGRPRSRSPWLRTQVQLAGLGHSRLHLSRLLSPKQDKAFSSRRHLL